MHQGLAERRKAENFLRLSRRMLEAAGDGLRLAFATHDRRLHGEIRAEARSAGASPGPSGS